MFRIHGHVAWQVTRLHKLMNIIISSREKTTAKNNKQLKQQANNKKSNNKDSFSYSSNIKCSPDISIS